MRRRLQRDLIWICEDHRERLRLALVASRRRSEQDERKRISGADDIRVFLVLADSFLLTHESQKSQGDRCRPGDWFICRLGTDAGEKVTEVGTRHLVVERHLTFDAVSFARLLAESFDAHAVWRVAQQAGP